MVEFWEFIKGTGALVGLATGAFVLQERLSKDAPIMFIVGLPYSIQGTLFPYLRVVNQSRRPMVLSWAVGVRRHEFTLRTNNSTRAIISSLMPGHMSMIVSGNTETDLPLSNPTNFNEISFDNAIELNVTWQLAQPIIYQRPRKKRIVIVKKTYELLLKGDARL